MFETALHIFTPRKSNDFKAKLLHFRGLAFLIVFLVLFQLSLQFGTKHTSILGYASSIPVSEVIRLTNVERQKNGLSELSLNQNLSNAAKLKGDDMLANDYWAHISPSGTEPWDFFKQVGYVYRYAGENLARDFSNPTSAVEAWMASPSHRENILSDKYQEIGIAVVEGDLSGEDTTIIVQLFGAKGVDRPSIPVASATNQDNTVEIETIPIEIAEAKAEEPIKETVPVEQTPEHTKAVQRPQITISPFTTTKTTSLIILAILFFVLVIDMIYIEARGVTRKSGRVFAHLSFLIMVLVIVFVARAGKII